MMVFVVLGFFVFDWSFRLRLLFNFTFLMSFLFFFRLPFNFCHCASKNHLTFTCFLYQSINDGNNFQSYALVFCGNCTYSA